MKAKAVNDQNAQSNLLYAKTKKIYPRESKGRFTNLQRASVCMLLGLYYLLPWLSWDDRQAVLFNLPARKFYIFAWSFWPQDFVYLALLLIIAALSLFFFTALAGRLWCGYACPQTAWTVVFIWMERWVEGDRSKQMKRDKAPWTRHKILVKTAKHTLWIVFALYTGITFVGYFTPITDLFVKLFSFSLGPWETFWLLFYSFATYGNAGWMREQGCIYMCPYARFQSAMFDNNTLVISYDPERGEPRGGRKRGVAPKSVNKGDCIDCTLCVQVCPTGIDIRDGLQYQCIGCAACIDVCNEVMDKMEYPRGLVRYTTENALYHKKGRVLRPRVFIYASLLLIFISGLFYAISQRTPLELDVIRDRNALYRETDQGLVENVYTLKLLNMDEQEHRYRLTLDGLPNMELIKERDEVTVAAGEILNLPVRIRIDPADLTNASTEIYFLLQAVDHPDLQTSSSSRFLGPTGY